ncbi:MAG: PVC-type heme-binding CxxCH protein [Mariniblastus sp.]
MNLKSSGNLKSTLLAAFISCFCTVGVFAQETPDPQKPVIEAASDEGVTAIGQFKFPKDLNCELYAGEPDVANIVAIHRDYQGNMFVCETFRQSKGVEDNRKHAHWMDEELAAQTVQDRIDYIRKYIPDADKAYTLHDDRIRLLKDTDGNGKPDSVSVFSDKYNKLEMGTGAGVLSHRGKVYYTCIPDLFELQDANNDGVAETRKSLHTGYGVRFAFRGHDLHGLIVGPDGRLYYSIGDRGYNISPTIKDPASGAVFRCELDGSNLEVVATGLRNPQELAFDDYGNLFTGDNNSDSGDMARWVEVVKGLDAGWRMYYQYQGDRGPFNREKIWYPYNEDTPAYIVPPIKNFADGPSGLEYYPGTGFGDDFKGRFFLCDFRGDAAVSGVRSFRNQADGAYWKLVDDEQPLWNMLITDIDFGSDGKLYAADWVFGWEGEAKARIYAFSDKKHGESEIVKQVEALLSAGFTKQKTDDLKMLLGHPDQRIRQESQFELVDREDFFTLKGIANDSEQPQMARIHAVWGLGQLGRKALANKTPFDSSFMAGLLADADPRVAGQTARVVSELAFKDSAKLAAMLKHSDHRARFRAAMALSAVGTDNDVSAVVEMLIDNADKDPMLRHGGIMALNGIFVRNSSPDLSPVAKLGSHDSRSVRIAFAIAMRKVIASNANDIYKHRQMASKSVSGLLKDSDKQIVLESARIIHDLFVKSEMGSLASLIGEVEMDSASDALVRRILSANVRVGAQANAIAVAKFAADEKNNADRRVEAIEALGEWAAPPARDMLLHAWRPLDANKRNVMDARNAISTVFAALIGGSDAITSAAITAAGDLNLTTITADLERVATADSSEEATRVAALVSLSKLKFKGLDGVLEKMEAGFDSLPENLASEVIDMVADKDEARGMALIEKAMAKGKRGTKQSAIETLGKLKGDQSAQMLASFLKRMNRDDFANDLRLDVSLAAANRGEDSVKDPLKTYNDAQFVADDPVSPYVDALTGGRNDIGSKVFYEKTEVSCVRCHKVDGTGGAVGPELSGIGLTRDRQYLLEAIVHPNKVIAEGFSQVKVFTDEGKMHLGIIKKETEDLLVLLDADGNEIVVEKDTIDDQQQGKSSMPADLIKQLSKKEVRDLVEFLSNRKTKPAKGVEHE